MELGVEQVKRSATWGGAKSGPTPPDNKAGEMTQGRKRSNTKRAGQFLLCFGLLLMFSINASAKKLSKRLSPELYSMVQTGDPNQSVDVIVQYKKRIDRKHVDESIKKHRAS